MKIIADSSSTRTEWVLCDGEEVIEHAFTIGLNPYFQTRREISHSIRLELPECFFKRRWDHVYFYGAGCASTEKNKIMESSLVAQFKTPVTVNSNLLGAARGMLVREPGLVCILGTGSNSCLYNGEDIVKNVLPLGFILGDEGSNAYMGKRFVADILKELAPRDIVIAFYDHYETTPNSIMEDVYNNTLPSRALAQYAFFLKDHIEHPYIHNLVTSSLRAFFERNIVKYDYRNNPISFVGSTCVMFEKELREVAEEFGASIKKIAKYSMPGLIKYHSED